MLRVGSVALLVQTRISAAAQIGSRMAWRTKRRLPMATRSAGYVTSAEAVVISSCRRSAIRTLAAYLDEQGSIVKTADRLHLHRNAVTNRLRTITELLDVDLEDPDQRLALQLACRARLLG